MTRGEYRLGYRGDIEGLRAVAILLVVCAHAGVPWLTGGFVGVDIFFVLSGFLITGLLLQELEATGGIRFSDFYARRLRRLFPALLVMVVLVSCAASVVLAPGEQVEQARTAAAAVFSVSNIRFAVAQLDYFSPGSEGNLFLHTWSLGVEEQFYLVWPVLLWWALGCGHGQRNITHLKWVMIGVVILSALACLLLTTREQLVAFYMMPMRAWQFAAGALIWIYFRKEGEFIAPVRTGEAENAGFWLGWLGLIMVAGPALAFDAHVAYPGWRALLPTFGTMAILVSGALVPFRGASAVLAWKPLQAIGKVSYAWYLWHWPVLLLSYAITESRSPWLRAVEVVLSFALAIASYWLIERPLRHSAQWLKYRRLALTGAISVMAVTAVLAMHWGANAWLKSRGPEFHRYARAHSDAPVIYGMGCDDWYHSDHVVMCSFGSADAGHTAVLMGDSIAGQWMPAFASIFQKQDWRFIVLTKSSCAMVEAPFFYERIGREYTECTSWRAKAMRQVASLKPDILVLGSASTYGFTQAQWMDGAASVLSVLSRAATQIYVLRGTPHLPFDGPDCLAVHHGRPEWLTSTQTCGASMMDEHGELVFKWLTLTSGHFTNVRMLDMNDVVCPDGRCMAERNGMIVFRDSQHLTASYAQSIAPRLAERMNLRFPERSRVIGALTSP
jgi:peptidoglycan/LPS O-acetylase OafA/YrhL